MADVVSRLQSLANYSSSGPHYTPSSHQETRQPYRSTSQDDSDRGVKRKLPPPPEGDIPSLLPKLEPEPKRRRMKIKRWNDPTAVRAFIPGVPLLLPSCLNTIEMNSLLLRARIEELTYQLKHDDFTSIPRRSPSPPPIYDGNGKRTNTREQRIKAKMERERHSLIEEARKLNPMFKPPSDYKPVSTKVTQKIRVPIDRHPEYNFIGLILGPRGSTQKEMEKKTGTKISIRGKGAVKNESKRRYNNPDDNEDLHVLITGDSEKSVKEAGRMIEQLLVPIDDEKNEHKWRQLELLAEWNGTKTGNWRGKRRNFNPENAPVHCAFCDEVSHPTSDCPFKDKPGAITRYDDDFKEFLSSIESDPSDSSSSQHPSSSSASAAASSNSSAEKSYDELMQLVNNLDGQSSGASAPSDPNAAAAAAQSAYYSQMAAAGWSQQQPPQPPGAPGAVPTNLTPEQQQQMAAWQAYAGGYPQAYMGWYQQQY